MAPQKFRPRLPLSSSEPAANPCRVAPQIKHRIDANDLIFHEVINSERESLGQCAMKAKLLRVNAGIEDERIDVSSQCSSKVAAHAGFLLLVKIAPVL